MLITLITHNPQAIGAILRGTPAWVWGLLTGLLLLGLSQLRTQQVTRTRLVLMPLAMTGFSLWGTVSAFGAGSLIVPVLLVWTTGALALGAWVGLQPPPRGLRFDPDSQRLTVPGSVWPLLLILGVFLFKYAIGVELVLQPAEAHELPFALGVAAVYGLFSGAFAGRALRRLKVVLAHTNPTLAAGA